MSAGRFSNAGHCAPPSSFSTYLAITSTSRLTVSPGSLTPSVVRLSVSGMRLTSNQSSPIAETVRLMPSTAMEPLCATYLARPGGRPMRTTSQCSCGARCRMAAVSSTWPWTRWPPSRSSRRTERSRLTLVPGRDGGEAGPLERLAHHIGDEAAGRRERAPVAAWRFGEEHGDGQADAVDRDGITGASIRSDHGATNVNAGGVTEMLDGLDLAEILHDAREHPRPPPVRLRGTRAIMRPRYGRITRARCLPSGL